MSDDEHGEGRGLDAASGPRDYLATLKLKHDHEKKPLWVCPNGRILLESGSPVEKEAVDFLVAIAEPRCRTRFLQEYQLTAYSLYAGASLGLTTGDINDSLTKFSKAELPIEVERKVHECCSRTGKVKLVMRNNGFFLECTPPQRGEADVAAQLLQDEVLSQLRVRRQRPADGAADSAAAAASTAAAAAALAAANAAAAAAAAADAAAAGLSNAAGAAERAAAAAAAAEQARLDAAEAAAAAAEAEEDDDGEADGADMHSFEVDQNKLKEVKARCDALDYPLIEEYDFKSDTITPNLGINLRSHTKVRDYQVNLAPPSRARARARRPPRAARHG